MGIRPVTAAAALALFAGLALAQSPGKKGPSVTLVPIDPVTVTRGSAGPVSLHFRVASGFHINSNTPKSDFLIPTTLRLDAPTDIAITRLSYPGGTDMSFPFAPDDKLSVYSGDFTVTLAVRPLHTVLPGKYAIHGELKYQACDNAACYPPKKLPVDFDVKVLKNATTGGKNPAQSPHAHR